MLSRNSLYARIHWVNGPSDFMQKEDREKVLNDLKEAKADLIWGDIIANINEYPDRDNGLYIYDGKEILSPFSDLCNPKIAGCLDHQFQVLKPHPVTGVPIHFDYWNGYYVKLDDIDEESERHSILHEKFRPYSRFFQDSPRVWISIAEHRNEIMALNSLVVISDCHLIFDSGITEDIIKNNDVFLARFNNDDEDDYKDLKYRLFVSSFTPNDI